MKNDLDHTRHKLHRCIEAQLHLLSTGELKEILKMATELTCGVDDDSDSLPTHLIGEKI